MTVAELIAFLQTQPQDMQVIARAYSEWNLLRLDAMRQVRAGVPRADGWVHDARPDKPTQAYLAFEGN